MASSQIKRPRDEYPPASYGMIKSPSAEGPGRQVHYEVETSSGRTGVVVYEVHEVYVHIPAELSAAGFELKIGGIVRITDRVRISGCGLEERVPVLFLNCKQYEKDCVLHKWSEL